MTTATDFFAERDASYGVRQAIADAIGYPRGTDLSFHGWMPANRPILARKSDGSRWRLLVTRNAGFNGIIADVESVDSDETLLDESLGAFTVVWPIA